jgi:hypothetical protein
MRSILEDIRYANSLLNGVYDSEEAEHVAIGRANVILADAKRRQAQRSKTIRRKSNGLRSAFVDAGLAEG